MQVLLVGNGQMAKLFADGLVKSGDSVWGLEHADNIKGNENIVALHVGSGRQLPELVHVCEKHRIPILNGSTGIKAHLIGIDDVPVVNAENFALPILRLLHILPDFAQKLNRPEFPLDYSVVESHQSTKKTLPGTAVRMASAVGAIPGDVTSIRQGEVQLLLGVPQGFLSAHGYHWITWEDTDLQIQLTTKVNGRGAYLKGGTFLLRKLIDHSAGMSNGLHDVLDFLKW